MLNQEFLEKLLNLPIVSFAKVSPDGRWVAFVWYHRHENMDVFLVPTDGSSPPVALTHTPEFTWLNNWTADSKSVIVEEDHDGDERIRFFQVAVDKPGEMIPLTEDRPPYFLSGGEPHPDSNALFYGANFDFVKNKPLEPTWIYRHDLTTGKRVAIAKPEKPAFVLMELNKAGTHLIYLRKDRHPSGVQFHLVDVEGKEDKEILNFGDEYKVFARWLPDNEHIIFTSESKDSSPQDHVSVGVLHWPSDTLRWLIDDSSRTIESLRVTPDGVTIVDEVRQARRVPTILDVKTGEETPFPKLPGNLIPLGRTPQGEWVAMYYAADQPTELIRFNLDARSPDDLVSLIRVWETTELTPDQLASAESVTWKSIDGLEIQGWLYRAEPDLQQAVVYVHGGPTFHSESNLNPQIQSMVAAGFNVLDVNYRGSTGFGLKFRECIKKDGWGGREQDDITTGAKFLIGQGLAETGKVGVTGTSYGGYSAWCQITRTHPDTIGAAAPICGMTDLVIDYNTTRPDMRPYCEEMIGGSPDEVPEKYHQRSPINFVQDIKGKVLIIQGGQDPNVTPENMKEVVKRLHLHDILYELEVFEDEGHGIYKHANQVRLYSRIAEFFREAFT